MCRYVGFKAFHGSLIQSFLDLWFFFGCFFSCFLFSLADELNFVGGVFESVEEMDY